MRIINVVEIVDNNTQGIESFGIFEEQLSQDVVDKAKENFKIKARENGCILEDEEMEDTIDNGYWESGNYSVSIVWSDIN